MKIAHEGFPTITIVGVFTALALFLSWNYLPLLVSVSLSSILLPVLFLSIYFFRDPERTLPINLSEEVLFLKTQELWSNNYRPSNTTKDLVGSGFDTSN